jgi:hypothetical protein
MSVGPGESIDRAIGRKNGNAGLQQAEIMTKNGVRRGGELREA